MPRNTKVVRLSHEVIEQAHRYADDPDGEPISDRSAIETTVLSTRGESLERIADGFSIRTTAKLIEVLTMARPDGYVVYTDEARWKYVIGAPGGPLAIDCGAGDPGKVKLLLRQHGIALDSPMLTELLDPEVSE